MNDELGNQEPQPGSDLTDHTLGDYLILRRLGRGGMADVYLAEQMSLKRQVAFKVLKQHLAEDPSYRKRFHNEAQAAAALVHANIVQIYEVGCLEGVHFIAQEYVPGRNLRQVVDRNGPLEPRLATAIIRQVAAALHLAAELGVVHRDIKPENILLTPRGDVKVADFGLARVNYTADNANITQDGVALGTPLYMSPEQVEGKRLDPRSDIYSLGATAYHVLVGHPPFQGDTPFGVAAQHLQKEPTRLESLRADAPEALCRVVHKMLAKNPADRYQTATELLRDLRGVGGHDTEDASEDWSAPEMFALADTRFEATQQLQLVMTEEAKQRQLARRRAVAVVGLLAVALVGGGGLAFLLKPSNLLVRGSQARAQVEVRDTAMEQYMYAVFISSRQKRRAALERFPSLFPPDDSLNNAYWWGLAQERLAEMLVEEEDYDNARKYYLELSKSDEAEFRAYGHAGLANDAYRRGAEEDVSTHLIEIALLRASLKLDTLAQIRRILTTELRARLDQTQV